MAVNLSFKIKQLIHFAVINYLINIQSSSITIKLTSTKLQDDALLPTAKPRWRMPSKLQK